MDRMFLILARLAITAIGFTLASFSAAMVIVYAIGFQWTASGKSGFDDAGQLLAAGLFVTLFVGMLSFIPAFIIIIITEVKRVRSVLPFLIGGGVTGAGAALWFFSNPGEARNWPVFAAAGVVAGFVYWLVAGRRAGEGITARAEGDASGG